MKSKIKIVKQILNDHYARILSIESMGKFGNFKSYKLDKTIPIRGPGIESSKEDLFVDLDAVKPDMIEDAISDLIEKVKSNIRLDQVKAICGHHHFIEKINKIDFQHGDIVTHDGEVAFKLDFKTSYNLSLLIDREGKLIK